MLSIWYIHRITCNKAAGAWIWHWLHIGIRGVIKSVYIIFGAQLPFLDITKKSKMRLHYGIRPIWMMGENCQISFEAGFP